MKIAIKKRMDDAIMAARLYNELFSIVVETSESVFNAVATQTRENEYAIEYNGLKAFIVCNDNEYNTISVTIDNSSTGGRVADLELNIHGGFNENYHSIPKALRTIVYQYAGDLSDMLEEFINVEGTAEPEPETTITNGEEDNYTNE